ncbi:hypothetical protein SLEP1_g51796 [Rubroshorea leprosula]|uniref:RRM domain-containing protein n=1 Tax=Rubroshorea leprosula TaxID=152421 RepID=A0AAV5M6K0_9ROSI|nr:hypothetical protein SLEP1_g51796 [Rubroshorea leprosula]
MHRNSQRSYLEAALKGQMMPSIAHRPPAPITPRALPSGKSVPYCTVPLDIHIVELYRSFGRFGFILQMRIKRKTLQHRKEVNVFYEHPTSEQRLLQGSPVLIDGMPVVIELKKPFLYY